MIHLTRVSAFHYSTPRVLVKRFRSVICYTIKIVISTGSNVLWLLEYLYSFYLYEFFKYYLNNQHAHINHISPEIMNYIYMKLVY